MDLDIEMDDAMDTAVDAPVIEPVHDDILQAEDAEEPGEVADDDNNNEADESKTVVPTKLNLRGVDSLHTSDIKAYVQAHFGPVDRVEWVDDSHANLVFGSEATARDAITALSTVPLADPSALAVGETLPAKPLEGRSDITLHVRFAVLTDRKQAGAALRSRYYLLHPEHDPEERRRRQQESRSRYRDRDGDDRRGGVGGGRRRRRDSDDEVERFEASMYDDAPRERRNSVPNDRPRSYASENRGKELFAGRKAARDRSASPMRDVVDDDDLMSSSSRNRTRARAIRDRISTDDNRRKELFPTGKSSGGRGGGRLDELERAIGSAQLKEEDRPKIVAVPDAPTTGGAFNIRGSASRRGDGEGFTIKGAAAANARSCFQQKLGGGNTGKELFDGSRTKRRQKAEDLFS